MMMAAPTARAANRSASPLAPVRSTLTSAHESRAKMHDAAWYCGYPHCEVAYFNQFDAVVLVDELRSPVYPKDLDAPICACFGLKYDDIEADVRDGTPTRIRDLLAKSKSPAANCSVLAADGRCCIGAVQELYMKLRSQE